MGQDEQISNFYQNLNNIIKFFYKLKFQVSDFSLAFEETKTSKNAKSGDSFPYSYLVEENFYFLDPQEPISHNQ